MSKLIEEWRPVVGYEGLYEVSDWGNVRSVDRVFEYFHPTANRLIKREFKGQMLNKIIDKYGYYKVGLRDENHKGNNGKVHRLVAEAFIPNPENKPCVDHINGIKTDNRVENLRWATVKENNNNPNTMINMRGIQNGRQLNRKDMSRMVFQYDLDWNYITNYPSASEAARQFGCHYGTIAKACRGWNNNKILNYNWSYELHIH